ncbi:MAG: LON peptidase substrate-binding domain-containing protein [Chloroflexi bacterium]|nr:LON peptidase substrate-binding domain-containing protein [Chloroflexota bacterium]
MRLPLFPLHSVLCPGVALPLHIFEERYRLLVSRCIDRSEPFGAVLIRDGREVGPMDGRLADVGTTALIRRAGRYPDGRLDIVTVGDRRFRVESLDHEQEPYLVGEVTLIDEDVGGHTEAGRMAGRVGQRFLRYLQLLQPALDDDGPEIEIEVEIEAPFDTISDAAPVALPVEGAEGEEAGLLPPEPTLDTSGLSPDQRRELLMAAARRLTATDDPTALSYLLTGLIQVDLPVRQGLLEVPDTVGRLVGLDALLSREIRHLDRNLRPISLDPRLLSLRRN